MTDLTGQEAETMSYPSALRAVADFLDAHPEFVPDIDFTNRIIYAPLGERADVRARMVEYARAAKAAGWTVRKSYDASWGNVDLLVGPIRLQVYAARDLVCERVVTGTREVTREIPDADALKAVPTVTVTETVEDVQWVCLPLLADADEPAAASA